MGSACDSLDGIARADGYGHQVRGATGDEQVKVLSSSGVTHSADVGKRARAFADAYGMTATQRARIIPVALRRAHNTTLTMRAA
ncbi:MAG: hypothetical protein WA966_05255, partial [Ornithinimicrobium sp.]